MDCEQLIQRPHQCRNVPALAPQQLHSLTRLQTASVSHRGTHHTARLTNTHLDITRQHRDPRRHRQPLARRRRRRRGRRSKPLRVRKRIRILHSSDRWHRVHKRIQDGIRAPARVVLARAAHDGARRRGAHNRLAHVWLRPTRAKCGRVARDGADRHPARRRRRDVAREHLAPAHRTPCADERHVRRRDGEGGRADRGVDVEVRRVGHERRRAGCVGLVGDAAAHERSACRCTSTGADAEEEEDESTEDDEASQDTSDDPAHHRR